MEKEIAEVCDVIRQTAYDLHVYLGVGYLEKVYETGLSHRLRKIGLTVETQVPIKVYDEDGYVLGDYIADMVVNGMIVELKAVETLIPAHIAQLINYMKSTKTKHGMLINFGSAKFQCRKIAL